MISLHQGRGSRRRKPAERVFQIRLKLAGCEPVIWRRLLVRETMWLSRLHDAIQVAFDWYDYQTHTFVFGDQRLGNPFKSEDAGVEDDRDVALADLGLEEHGRFTYTYHFDEGWELEGTIEQIQPLKKGATYPRCLGGSRAGPPEDCGGPGAYHDMLACLEEPDSDIGREWREWLGPDYDPEAMDLERINRGLGKLRK